MALSLRESEQLLSYACPIAAVVLLLKLGHENLLQRYRYLSVYLACLAAELIVVLLGVPGETTRYLRTYMAVETVLWAAQILVVVELFTLVVREYPGISRSGRNVLLTAVALAAGVAYLVAGHHSGSGLAKFSELNRYFAVARVVALTLLIFLALTLSFLYWFLIPLSRNLLVYAIGFSVYFTCRALTRLFGTFIQPDQLHILSVIALSVLLGCILLWSFAMTRHGENVSVVVGRRRAPGQSQAMADKLESINATLLGTARK